MRRTLVTALAECADGSLKPAIRRFLLGLSRDELQFIADFLGACILESPSGAPGSGRQLARRVAEFHQARLGSSSRFSDDQDHKMILLVEYLCRGGVEAPSAGRV